MKQFKRFLFRVGFATEIALFGFFYLFGINGLSAVRLLEKQNSEIIKKIRQEQQAIEQLNDDISHWHSSGFQKEKIAREKLQMIKNDEIVYFF